MIVRIGTNAPAGFQAAAIGFFAFQGMTTRRADAHGDETWAIRVDVGDKPRAVTIPWNQTVVEATGDGVTVNGNLIASGARFPVDESTFLTFDLEPA